jgi:predicted DNA-binding transcriptional regulator AlpA
MNPLDAIRTSTTAEQPRAATTGSSAPNAHYSQFIDERQLCADLGISSVTATKWRARAEGPPFIKVGRLVRYRRTDVDAWLASRTIGLKPV